MKPGQIVKFFPSAEDEKLQNALGKEKHLSAKVINVHADDVVDLVVNVPDGQNVLKNGITSGKKTTGKKVLERYETL